MSESLFIMSPAFSNLSALKLPETMYVGVIFNTEAHLALPKTGHKESSYRRWKPDGLMAVDLSRSCMYFPANFELLPFDSSRVLIKVQGPFHI